LQFPSTSERIQSDVTQTLLFTLSLEASVSQSNSSTDAEYVDRRGCNGIR